LSRETGGPAPVRYPCLMGRAQGTVEHRFKSVFGTRRGSDHALRGPQAVPAWQRLVSQQGLEEAIRALGPDRSFLLEHPELSRVVAGNVLDDSYTLGRPLVRQWLKALGVRPHWMEEIVNVETSGEDQLHLLQPGHIATDNTDLNEWRPPLMCTGHPPDDAAVYLLYNRGGWNTALHSSNPAMPKLCPFCAAKAQEHPEAQERDESDPWPADVLEADLVEWRQQNQEEIISQVARGAELLDMEKMTIDSLYSYGASWAARRLAAYPRELTLRSLRSNGSGIAGFNNDNKNLPKVAKRIAESGLSEDVWLEEILTHRENEGTAGDWAMHLMRMAAPEKLIMVRHGDSESILATTL